MKLFNLVLAVTGTLAAALPNPQSLTPNDGRGATVFKEQNLKGDSTAIPSNLWCTDLNNIFGGFDYKVRSVIVEKGYRCRFYTLWGCPADAENYEFGSKEQALAVGELPGWLDRKIHSVWCGEA
ncbi:hypothetical protein BKA63DRAFT_554808 [Paraphoma chrysanthemicola]|nr:hypothetical protein BKA63DRAFT_554808 [Paraphoma chrysanthemicola]